MLSEYEASVLAKQKAAARDLPLARTVPAPNRIGAVLVALSLLAAVGLLYSAFFSDRGRVSQATQVAPDSTTATPFIHPAASGLPEAALFLRHPSEAVLTTAGMAASIQ